MSRPIRVGITHGDTNSISYELILKALDNELITELCTPVVFGSSRVAAWYRKALEMETMPMNQVNGCDQIRDGECNLVNITPEEIKIEVGKPTGESGRAALLSLKRAIEALRNGDIDVLVTAPINKQAIQSDEFHFPGHTEYLQSKLGEDSDKALMILFSDRLRVALVTTHLPVNRVSQELSVEKISDTVRAFDNSLRRDFGLGRPRIAVLGLNPHNGDGGLLGDEEQTMIIPAIEQCNEDGLLVFGPFAADGFFGSGAYTHYDGVVAMYHDQGLAPFKAIASESGVNFTAGLPYVRTSPDHGTAYDIAGQGVADPTSFRQAIYEAVNIYRNREAQDEAEANPLRRHYVERGADKTVDFSKDKL